ncbi:DUF1353 domain-containing protein [Halomonas sp. 1390]|uniref:DUF1353 domain-containing protein n=1 Tax=Halomonas sp. B23F22_3 TaxID=3459516 RepID=UPI00373EC4AD
MNAEILQLPWTERYFGDAPEWIAPGRAMVILRRAMRLRITEDDGTRWVLEIPEGYVSDRASVPRLAAWFALPAGDLEVASYPHDWIYSHGGRLYGKDKTWADALFRAVIKATPTDVPGWRIAGSYYAVRLGGDGGWKHGWADWPEPQQGPVS